MSFDTKCYDLAKDFLSEEDNLIGIAPDVVEKYVNELAQQIQDTIEDYLEDVRARR